jgi:hypothetical protein
VCTAAEVQPRLVWIGKSAKGKIPPGSWFEVMCWDVS